MTDIKLILSEADVESIVRVLGNLPTSSNAWPLLAKIAQQHIAQRPQEISQKIKDHAQKKEKANETKEEVSDV